MTEENLSNPSLQVLKLFLSDLQSQQTIFNQVIQKIDDEDFIKNQYGVLIKICRTLLASSKIVQLKTIENFIQNFENFVAYLKAKATPLTVSDKDLIHQVYQVFEEMNQISEAELKNDVQQKKQMYDALNEKMQSQIGITEETKARPVEPEPKMLELFKGEIETQIKSLIEDLLGYQRNREEVRLLDSLMRSAHSIKGAAKVFSFNAIVKLAHVLEDCFIAIKEKQVFLDDDHAELIFKSLDSIREIIHQSSHEITSKLNKEQETLDRFAEEIKTFIQTGMSIKYIQPTLEEPELAQEETRKDLGEHSDRILRMTAENLNRLMGLAAESMVETRWLRPFCDSLLRLKIANNKMFIQMDYLKNSLGNYFFNDVTNTHYHSLMHTMHEYQNELSDRLADLEMFITRHSNLTDRLYEEVIESRMRPFADGVDAFPRMVWETARHLKKKVRLEIKGKSILIDRDILEKLEAPLAQILRNAIDHGIETPDERLALGKPQEGLIKLEASNRAGMLGIIVEDDGRGIHLADLRKKIVEEKLATEEMVFNLTEQELLQFLFLPGFSTSHQVTDISGRGIGLNIVQTMLQDVGGTVHIENHPGKSLSFHLELPLTLSVMRALIVRVGRSTLAFPLARIEQAVSIKKNDILKIENREFFSYLGTNVGLIWVSQLLNIQVESFIPPLLPIVVIRSRSNLYGLIVDEFLGEKELVLQDTESHIGKVPCVSAGSVLENGTPVLIVDLEDIIELTDKQLNAGKLYEMDYQEGQPLSSHQKRILVVDDSISVREVECRLLKNRGYAVDSAVNGADAWNAVRLENYDLVVTDVDMPRMNGIELIRNIKNDVRLKNLPVMIVSYKERESDRIQGLEAGANYYLAKSTFGDEALIQAVIDLIGEP
ncbi:MAG: hypothetical protein BGO14_04160 [Chlamydiales bacterium 38-26]|nr:hybrid sensor histidine kinase/response regulator [Chlamydiales bacterium]OJV07691.1 MAG: hypothetical protein BGO14_04160 [Chlamydiales bacterium 38-26]